MIKYWLVVMAAVGLIAPAPAQAQISDGVIKIGVLTDMSSLYADLSGQGSVIAARMAVEDFGAAKKGMKVEIISADHQNKADVGSGIARQWLDSEQVDVIMDTPNSAVALAVNQIVKEKGRAFLVSGAASSDLSGQGSVVAARMAVEDFGAAAKGMKVEIVGADHQNKPDVGSNVVRTWIDTDKVDVIVDVPTSSVALAVNEIVRDKNKVFLVSGAAASDLTGAKCTPNTIHWTYDTWALANGTGSAIVKTGGDSWFFITADYAFGHALERDT